MSGQRTKMRPERVYIDLVAIQAFAQAFFDFELGKVGRKRSQDHRPGGIEHAASHEHTLCSRAFQKSPPYELFDLRIGVIHEYSETPSITALLPASRLGSANKTNRNRKITGF